jgi:FkbM family methyltransferase
MRAGIGAMIAQRFWPASGPAADGRYDLRAMAMRFTRRVVAAASRRLERPELLAAFYPGARQELREEIAIRAILASTLAPDSTYIDVGANRGQILGEAVRIAPRGRHLAFEPIPELAAQLARAFPAIECRQLALSSSAGEAGFCHFRGLDGWSGLRRNPEISDARGQPEYIRVHVSTLDDELDGLIPRVVKIDVEGAEQQVLEGASATLAHARPTLIVEHVNAAASVYGTAPDAPWELLTAAGYEIFSVTGQGPYSRAQFAANETVVNWLATATATGADA